MNRYLGRSVSVAFPPPIVTRLAVSIAVSFPTYLHMQLSLHPIKANVGLVKSKTQCEIITECEVPGNAGFQGFLKEMSHIPNDLFDLIFNSID